MDLVSIIVPCFNSARTLRAAVISALEQSHHGIEVIVIDDGSIDEGLAVLAGIDDDRLRTIRNPSNVGVGPSRDCAIDASRGKWIAVLDADDAFKPSRIERMLEATECDETVIVFDDLEECVSVGGRLSSLGPMRGRTAFGHAVPYANVSAAQWLRSQRLLIKPLIPTTLIQSSGIRHSSRPYAEDAEFFIKLIQAGGRLRYIPEALYLYRISSGTASANPLRHKLMVEVLEVGKTGFADDKDALSALQERIASEAFLHGYFQFLRKLKDREILSALSVLIKNPRYLREMAVRSARTLKQRSMMSKRDSGQ